MLTEFMNDWFTEHSRWVDAVIKTAAAESADNKALISGWAVTWRDRIAPALAPLAQRALGNRSDDALAAIVAALNTRAAKLGLSV